MTTSPPPTRPLPPRQSAAARWIARMPLLAYRAGLGELVDVVHILVLTTRDRRTGQPRTNALEYRAHGSRLYVLSSWGDQANWVQNLLTDGAVTVQRGAQTLQAYADPVTQRGEALLAVRLFHGTGPFLYDSVYTPMQALRGRTAVAERVLPAIVEEYTVIRLTPQPGVSTLPPVAGDLRWILPAAGMATAGLTALGLGLYLWRTFRSRKGRG